jgi:hypothetical protein
MICTMVPCSSAHSGMAAPQTYLSGAACRRGTCAVFPIGRAEIGVGLTGLGFLFILLGVLFFFDRGLLAMGNVRLCRPWNRALPPGCLAASMHRKTCLAPGGTPRRCCSCRAWP